MVYTFLQRTRPRSGKILEPGWIRSLDVALLLKNKTFLNHTNHRTLSNHGLRSALDCFVGTMP